MAKKHVFGSDGKVAGTDCQTLACALDITAIRNTLHITARRFNYVAVRVRVGMRFCKVRVMCVSFGLR